MLNGLAALLAFCLSCSGVPMQSIAYNDSHIQYDGRFDDTGTGMTTVWGGSQIVFKVSGTSKIIAHLTVADPDTTYGVYYSYSVDNNISQSQVNIDINKMAFASTSTEVYTGPVNVLVPLPDTNEHTIIFHIEPANSAGFSGFPTSSVVVIGYEIDGGATISTWTQGPHLLQTIGDSWMGPHQDWPRLQDRTRWKIYPIAMGGMKASDMASLYPYKYGTTAQTDPAAYAIENEAGVNDYGSGVTTSAYKTAMETLIAEEQSAQPGVPIMLIRVPDDVNRSQTYGTTYGATLSSITADFTGVYYCDTTSLDTELQGLWIATGGHLEGAGKQILANFVDACWTTAGY